PQVCQTDPTEHALEVRGIRYCDAAWLDPSPCPKTSPNAWSTEESTPCALSTKIEPDSRGTRPAMTEVGARGGAPRDDGADSVVATRSRILMVRCAPLSRMMRERTHCRPFNFKQQSVHMVRDGAMRLLTMRVRVHLSSHETSSCEEAAGGRVSKDGTPG